MAMGILHELKLKKNVFIAWIRICMKNIRGTRTTASIWEGAFSKNS